MDLTERFMGNPRTRSTVLSGLHHVGHLTHDFDQSLAYYRDALGGSVGEQTVVEDSVRVVFVEWPDFRVELVDASERGTYLDELLDALVAESPYHLAVTVPDIESAMSSLSENGYPLFDDEPVEGLGPYVRAFVEPDAVPGPPLELIELND